MEMKIAPYDTVGGREVFHVTVNGRNVGVDFQTYDDACKVANVIASTSHTTEPIVIDYSECVKCP